MYIYIYCHHVCIHLRELSLLSISPFIGFFPVYPHQHSKNDGALSRLFPRKHAEGSVQTCCSQYFTMFSVILPLTNSVLIENLRCHHGEFCNVLSPEQFTTLHIE